MQKKLIYFAKKDGANAVKLQTYTPDMMTIKSKKFKINSGLWANNNLRDLYKKAHTPIHLHKKLFAIGTNKNLRKRAELIFEREVIGRILIDKLCPCYYLKEVEVVLSYTLDILQRKILDPLLQQVYLQVHFENFV